MADLILGIIIVIGACAGLFFTICALEKKLINEIIKKDKVIDSLFSVILCIRRDLSYLQLKDCPKEEFYNIPKEIIYWIDQLMRFRNDAENKEK